MRLLIWQHSIEANRSSPSFWNPSPLCPFQRLSSPTTKRVVPKQDLPRESKKQDKNVQQVNKQETKVKESRKPSLEPAEQ
mmetsp:Transcript_28187/g.36630  ORF Transcript_28187/g.36630 Transcript_28187/m.36630 type:complete len:80 (+) Transcript_28187:50-289(+)